MTTTDRDHANTELAHDAKQAAAERNAFYESLVEPVTDWTTDFDHMHPAYNANAPVV